MLVCEGVQHAHQKAIIHRDLKPSNILVAEIDGKPMPRIIDFGVAKATSLQLSGETLYTRWGAVLGTLGYMSPEQADSAGEGIDTRTDVYSLGVVLYELLVGALPFDFQKLAFDEVLRQLREQDAPRPSTKLRTLGGKSASISQNRGADPPTLIRQLRGEPDAIALKALEKDRARRYATPMELAADLGRYLRHEPVTAHPPSRAYRARKYIRRHRLGVAVAAGGVLLPVAFAAVQAVRTAAHHARARPRGPHHSFHDRHVQGVRPQRRAEQQHHGQGNPGQSLQGDRHRAVQRSRAAGPDDAGHGGRVREPRPVLAGAVTAHASRRNTAASARARTPTPSPR